MTAVNFTCRLPVTIPGKGSDPPQIGFVSFPDATFSPDVKDRVISDSEGGTYTTSLRPRLAGNRGYYYDAVAKYWLPAERQAVSPDGSQYAWAAWDQTTNPATSTLHVVEVATGDDRTFVLKNFPLVPIVMDFDGSTIYLESGYEGPPAGLWAFDVRSSTLKRVADLRFVEAVLAATGIAWLGGVDPSDPNPPQEIEGGSSNELVRGHIDSGATEQWYYAPGLEVLLIGFDTFGQPIVSAGGDLRSQPPRQASYRLITAQGQATEIASGQEGFLYHADGDSHGLWFTGNGGIYFYRANQGLAKVWAGNVRTIAGSCR